MRSNVGFPAGLICLSVCLMLMVCAAALARPVTETERQALEKQIASFSRALETKAYDDIADVTPPRLVDHLAKTAQMEPGELRRAMVEQMKVALAAVRIESFSFDMAKAEYRELSGGHPYALVPTELIAVDPNGVRTRFRSQTLALLDGNSWYLIRLQEAQHLLLLQKAYPEFTGVEFPRGSMELLK
ncbi:hypothetical protein EDC40_101225 [Aminobacter aminovorans]|uniref:Uncharacterized protein n=1 Tax=Aminobacter aminovorans TaxID=83263 RepID=A0A380WP50_AMIAI|nr:hypothetical protein [Aminobacter aminovorans]TCS29910.1 hypothetical protein EDC40_101225 [Aminobacter aminovorans]SUU90759.1 Uncharacterised protein [Aminobacter aminovorans]